MISYLGGGFKIKPESKRSIDTFHLHFSPKIWTQTWTKTMPLCSQNTQHKQPAYISINISRDTTLQLILSHYIYATLVTRSCVVTIFISSGHLEHFQCRSRTYLSTQSPATYCVHFNVPEWLQYSFSHGVIICALTNQIKDTILGKSNKCIWCCP